MNVIIFHPIGNLNYTIFSRGSNANGVGLCIMFEHREDGADVFSKSSFWHRLQDRGKMVEP